MEELILEEISILFEPAGCKAKISFGKTVLEAARQRGIMITNDCGGQGFCGKCKIIPSKNEDFLPLTPKEYDLLEEKEIKDGIRLACQAIPRKDTVVFIPRESRESERIIQTLGFERSYPINPNIKKIYIEDNIDELESEPLEEKIIHILKQRGIRAKFCYQINNLSEKIKNAIDDFTVILHNRKIIAVEEGNTSDKLFGLAVDIGTSKIVCHLVDLNNGISVAIESTENPQVAYGEDLMSRITYAMRDPKNASKLTNMLHLAINKLLDDAYSRTNISPDLVYETVLGGNTLMHHLFLGLDPTSLGSSPFKPVIDRPVTRIGSMLGLNINNVGNIYLPPPIAGFVGSDALSDLLAVGIYESEDLSMIVDIGTNTEIFVGNLKGFEACSCASGPAFEGAHITNGVKAIPGAIERVQIDSCTFQVNYSIIGGLKPIGLCGSAIVDTLAEMWSVGLVDDLGRITGEVNNRGGKFDKEFLLVPDEKTGINRDIIIDQDDVKEILKAKASIHAACLIMLKRREAEANDLSKIYVAGAFGNSLNAENAIKIGLIPGIDPEKVEFVGNTAVSGVKMQLISNEARKTAVKLIDMITYHELSLDPLFNKEYINSLFIPYRKL